MAHKKIGWLANATMKDNGIFASNGEALISGKFDKAAQDAFNGKAKKEVKVEKPKAEKKESNIKKIFKK